MTTVANGAGENRPSQEGGVVFDGSTGAIMISSLSGPMKVQILYFAVLRERVRQSTQELVDVPPGATAAQLLQRLRNEHGECTFAGVRVACNEEFVSETHVLHDGDIVALIPPVSGG